MSPTMLLTTTTETSASSLRLPLPHNDERSTIEVTGNDQKEQQQQQGTAIASPTPLTLPKCAMPSSELYGPVESLVAMAVETQHLQPPSSHGGPSFVDAYRGLMDTIRKKDDLEMLRFILLALRTSGRGKTLTYLTQTATQHAHLIHLIVRLNPYQLRDTSNNGPAWIADYDIADAQLHLLMAIVSSNSVFLVPTLTSLWRFLTHHVQEAPVER